MKKRIKSGKKKFVLLIFFVKRKRLPIITSYTELASLNGTNKRRFVTDACATLLLTL